MTSSTYLGIFILGFCCSFVDSKIPCKLTQWESSNSEKSIPKSSLPLGGITAESFVIRDNVDDKWMFGTLVKTLDSDNAYIPSSSDGNSSVTPSYEILTNPEECDYAWQPAGNQAPEFAMVSNPGSKLYVGRVFKDGVYYAGEVDYSKSSPTITVAYPEGTEEEESLIYVLTSYSPGLKCILTDVVVPPDPYTNDGAVLATEEIRNFSEAEIIQTFQHSNIFTTTTVNEVKSKFTNSSVKTFGFFFLVAGKKTTEETSYTKEVAEKWTVTKTTEVTVTREIFIPSYSSILACSVVSIRSNLTVNYNATAVYTAPGLEPTDILQVLKNDGVDNAFIDSKGRVVITGISGTFSGNLVLDSTFHIFDLTQGDVSCGEEDQKFRKSLLRKQKRFQ